MSMLDLYQKKNDEGGYTLGEMFLDYMRSKSENDIFQIDAATGEAESHGSVLSRSIRLARSLRNFCLQPGDNIALAGRNHNDLHIPYYAGLMVGLPVVGVDPLFKYDEIKYLVKITAPKIAFCQEETRELFERAARELALDIKVVTFDGDHDMNRFMEEYDEHGEEGEFQVSKFDTDKVYAWLVTTSGTTGSLKVAAFKNQILIEKILAYMRMGRGGDGTKMALHLSPVQWMSSYFNATGLPMLGYIKLQTSRSDLDHFVDVINKYKPVSIFSSPSLLIQLMHSPKRCDMTCFNSITVTGSKVYADVLAELKSRLRPDAVLIEAYGQTESVGPVLLPNPKGPVGSCGVPMPNILLKLVDPDTNKEITEPNIIGELWTKGKGFTEYYGNPEETERAFSGGWYRTGDLMRRDEDNNYYFVDRLKTLIKYRNYHIYPTFIEEAIQSHPGVCAAAVVGVPHAQDGWHPLACVVRQGSDVTEDDVHRIVADKFSDSQRLRGGVIFVDELPTTSTGKVALRKLNQMVRSIKNIQ